MNTQWSPEFRDPKVAFSEAIARGSLTDKRGYFKYAGDWMYMGTEDGFDMFKNIITREYIHVKVGA